MNGDKHMREVISRMYGTASVNVSVNRQSHVARSSKETVYECWKLKTKNRLSTTEMAIQVAREHNYCLQ